jgi:hypothetical protein
MTYILSACKLFDFALPIMRTVAADRHAAESMQEWIGHSKPD